MRHCTPKTVVFAAAALCAVLDAVPALAVREPGPLKASPSNGMATTCLLLLAALIIGVSMMNPRRTHQD